MTIFAGLAEYEVSSSLIFFYRVWILCQSVSRLFSKAISPSVMYLLFFLSAVGDWKVPVLERDSQVGQSEVPRYENDREGEIKGNRVPVPVDATPSARAKDQGGVRNAQATEAGQRERRLEISLFN